jgi:hypothetical protein
MKKLIFYYLAFLFFLSNAAAQNNIEKAETIIQKIDNSIYPTAKVDKNIGLDYSQLIAKLLESGELNIETYNALSKISNIYAEVKRRQKLAIETNQPQDVLENLQYNVTIIADLKQELDVAWQKNVAQNGNILETEKSFTGSQYLYFTDKNKDTTIVFDMSYRLNLVKCKKNGYTYWEVRLPKEHYLPQYNNGMNEYLIDAGVPKTIMWYGVPILSKPTILVSYTPEEGKTELIFSNSFVWLTGISKSKSLLPNNICYQAWSYKLEISAKDNTVKSDIDLFRPYTHNKYTIWIDKCYNRSIEVFSFDELTKAIDKHIKEYAKK